MNSYPFGYGMKTVELDFTGAGSVRVLQGESLPPVCDFKEQFLNAVGPEAIASPPLWKLIAPEDQVTIVISDITRFWMRQDRVCAQLVAYLHDALGVAYDNIAVLVALGTHRAQTEEELRLLASAGVYEKVRVLNHNCMAPDLKYLGTTSRGTEVWMNPMAVGRKVITIGGTLHHLMAGYAGGRKSILPGISGKKSIFQNHVHSLSPTMPGPTPSSVWECWSTIR
jgi:nickel-dependent lactate racemase